MPTPWSTTSFVIWDNLPFPSTSSLVDQMLSSSLDMTVEELWHIANAPFLLKLYLLVYSFPEQYLFFARVEKHEIKYCSLRRKQELPEFTRLCSNTQNIDAYEAWGRHYKTSGVSHFYGSPLFQTQFLGDLRPAEKQNMVRRSEMRALPVTGAIVKWRGSSERQSIRSTVISTDSWNYTLTAANIYKRLQKTIIPSCQALSMSFHLFPQTS